jgi:glutathione S-transferase
MSVELFTISGSPFAWRVQLALEYKGVPYEARVLQVSKNEHRSPEYLAINPRGRVPALRDGELVVCDSLAILAYLERKHPTPPLFGATPAETARVWQTLLETVAAFDRLGDDYTVPIYYGRTVEEAAKIRAAVPALKTELASLDETLRWRTWLVGNAITAADLALYPMAKSLERATGKSAAAPFGLGFVPVADRYRNVARWMQRIEALPGYDRTYPPHWRTA